MKKNSKKRVITLTMVLLVISIPIVLYLLSFKAVAFDQEFHKKEFKRYNVYKEFPDIDETNSILLHYLRYDKTNDFVDIDKFNQREKEHLLDVKNLIQNFLIALNIVIVLLLVLILVLFLLDKKNFLKKITLVSLWGGIITFFDALLFFLIVKINFGSFFTWFHNIFFKSGTWLFDASDNLVMIYQEKFFYDILIRIITYTWIVATVLVVVGLVTQILKQEKSVLRKHIK